MPFLHSLIYEKIELSVIARTQGRDPSSKDLGDSSDFSLDDQGILQPIQAESMEGLSHSERPSAKMTDEHCLIHVRISKEVSLMVKYN